MTMTMSVTLALGSLQMGGAGHAVQSVWPNCHAMLRRTDPQCSIENLRARLR